MSTFGVIISPDAIKTWFRGIWFCAFPPLLLASLSLSLSCCPPLSLMMGVFLFCGGCELSEFVFVTVIPSASAPAYKSGWGAQCVLTRLQSPFRETSVRNTSGTGETRRRTEGSASNGEDLVVCESECWLITFELISALTG